MAKIREYSVRSGKYYVLVQIMYYARDERFTIKPPEEWESFSKLTKIPIPSAKSEEELYKLLQAFADKFSAATIKTRQMIAYCADWQSANVEGRVNRSWGSQDEKNKAYIEFEYKVVTEERFGDKVEYFIIDALGRHHYQYNMRGWRFIEWTEKREKFFLDFYQAMEKLMAPKEHGGKIQ